MIKLLLSLDLIPNVCPVIITKMVVNLCLYPNKTFDTRSKSHTTTRVEPRVNCLNKFFYQLKFSFGLNKQQKLKGLCSNQHLVLNHVQNFLLYGMVNMV